MSGGRYAALAGGHDSCGLDLLMMMMAFEDPEVGDVPMGHAPTEESVVPVPVPKSSPPVVEYPPPDGMWLM